MSKNIDEIDKVVESVLPEKMSMEFEYHEAFCMYQVARRSLKQALTDKKMVVPMSEEDLFTIIRKYVSAREIDLVTKSQKDLAKEIYERQFKVVEC